MRVLIQGVNIEQNAFKPEGVISLTNTTVEVK